MYYDLRIIYWYFEGVYYVLRRRCNQKRTYRLPITQNANGLDFDHSRPLGVDRIDGFGLPIHDFLFRFNSIT